MKKCLVCNKEVKEFLNLGKQPISNAFLTKEQCQNEYFYTLKVGFCLNCKMIQILESPDKSQMFHQNYSFLSSSSKYIQEHFKNFADTIIKTKSLTKKSFIVEIGCNDGTLIHNFTKKNIPSLGVEPSKNVADIAKEKGISISTDFFDEDLADKIISKYDKADIIISTNTISHISHINSIFKGIKKLLKNDGYFIFEDRYAGDIITNNFFDQIYDEHIFLFYLTPLCFLANMHGLEVIDIQHQITHGGSMRYTLAHKGHKTISSNINKQLQKEKKLKLYESNTYKVFSENILLIRQNLMNLLNKLQNEGKKVVGYGATAKSATIINFFSITPKHIECIYDTTPIKHNKFSPGAHIPIKPYEDFKKSMPDYVLLFAWNHSKEIMAKEEKYMKSNNIKWIIYVPRVEII